MDPISAFLSSLGPWGVVAGVGLTIAGQFIRGRFFPAPPAAPVAAPTPVVVGPVVPPPVAPAPVSHPVLDALFGLIKAHVVATAPAPVAPDISHTVALDLLAKFFPAFAPPPK